jgi:hypothetical protein
MPLVPEHVLGPDAAVAGAWDLIVAEDIHDTGEADATAEFDRTDR